MLRISGAKSVTAFALVFMMGCGVSGPVRAQSSAEKCKQAIEAGHEDDGACADTGPLINKAPVEYVKINGVGVSVDVTGGFNFTSINSPQFISTDLLAITQQPPVNTYSSATNAKVGGTVTFNST